MLSNAATEVRNVRGHHEHDAVCDNNAEVETSPLLSHGEIQIFSLL